jgi:hypothetical protein
LEEYNKVPPPEQQHRPAALKSTQSNPYLQQRESKLITRETASAPVLPDSAKADLLVDISTEQDLDDLPSGWCYAHGKSSLYLQYLITSF